MVNEHPTLTELEDFVWKRLSAERLRAIVSHLLHGCETCSGFLAPHFNALHGEGMPPERVLSAREAAEYDAAFRRVLTRISRTVADIQEGRKQEALALLATSGLEGLPDMPSHLRGIPLFEALLERSWNLRHADPEEMVRLAEWALALAEKLDLRELSPAQAADMRCRAWMELGNAYRVADELVEAEEALSKATEVFVQGTQDDLLAARLFDIQASLYSDRRRFDLADAALEMVFSIYQRHGDDHLAGRALISKAIYTGYEGDPEEAVRLLERGLELIDEHRDPRLLFVTLHNQARFLVDCGRLREARIALWKLKSRGLDPGGRINELKVRWLEGQVNAGLGELDRAELALTEVQRGFEEIDLGYKAALTGLELGALYLRRGKNGEAVRAVLEAADVFIALGIGREAGASVLLLRKNFERQLIDTGLLEYVIDLLRRGEEAAR
jgi:tetratricopeptide (TPR) repeat protein